MSSDRPSAREDTMDRLLKTQVLLGYLFKEKSGHKLDSNNGTVVRDLVKFFIVLI